MWANTEHDEDKADLSQTHVCPADSTTSPNPQSLEMIVYGQRQSPSPNPQTGRSTPEMLDYIYGPT